MSRPVYVRRRPYKLWRRRDGNAVVVATGLVHLFVRVGDGLAERSVCGAIDSLPPRCGPWWELRGLEGHDEPHCERCWYIARRRAGLKVSRATPPRLAR